MRLALVSYFDCCDSYNLDDGTQSDDPQKVGIRNPLGDGLRVPLDAQIMQDWRNEAASRVDDSEMELAIPTTFTKPEIDAFKEKLRHLIKTHDTEVAELRLHAVGIAYVYVEFKPGIPLEQLKGFFKCFEVAAYGERWSDPKHPSVDPPQFDRVPKRLLELATETGQTTFAVRGVEAWEFTRRPPPTYRSDDLLFRSFTLLILCIDPGDSVSNATSGLLSVAKIVKFEYHGSLHYGWSGCALEPRGKGKPRDEIERMLKCIQIAHVCLGTCEAFDRLLLDRAVRQAKHFPRGRWWNRIREFFLRYKGSQDTLGPRDLNRVRALAHTVVSLTDFRGVTPAAEDQEYFQAFAQDAQLPELHARIRQRCEAIHSVELVETQSKDATRAGLLNWALFFVTAATLILVGTEYYKFEPRKTDEGIEKFWLVTGLVAGLSLVVYLATRIWPK